MGKHEVAPLVEAWIEIALLYQHKNHFEVAPLVEAWIEISLLCLISASVIVAPLVEAWIEIKCHDYSFLHPMLSLPSWKRGLKCAGVLELLKWDMSLPSWKRGLK